MTETSILPGTTPASGDIDMVPPGMGPDDDGTGGDRRRLIIIGAVVGLLIIVAAAYMLLHKSSSASTNTGLVPHGTPSAVHSTAPKGSSGAKGHSSHKGGT